MPEPLYASLRVDRDRITVVPAPSLLADLLREPMFTQYEGLDVDLRRLPDHLAIIPFLLNVAPVIWVSGRTYEVPALDADLAASLDAAHALFKKAYPGLGWEGKIVTQQILQAQPLARPSEAVGVLFSGGVDSVATSLRQLPAPQVLVTVQGGDISLRNEPGWQLAKNQNQVFAARFAHRLVFVRTNIQDALRNGVLNNIDPGVPNWWSRVQHGLALAGAAWPALILLGAHRLCLASTFAQGTSALGDLLRAVDEGLRVHGGQTHHEGADLSRQDKVDLIVRSPAFGGAGPPLRVCYKNPLDRLNCSRCEKCVSTMVNLVAAGAADLAPFGFDLAMDRLTRRLRRTFRSHTFTMSAADLPLWEDAQNAARERTLPANAQGLADWLLQFDFARYVRTHQRLRAPKMAVRGALARVGLLGLAKRLRYKIRGEFTRPSGYR